MINLHDVLTNVPDTTIKCLDHGHVRLVDVMPRLVPIDTKTADFAIVQAARVSYGDGTKSVNEDRGLIRYLMRHYHSTPTEMIEFKFHIKLPIVAARQIIRHRTTSVNEISGRYSILKEEFYIPENQDIRVQSKLNKQGGEDLASEEVANEFIRHLSNACKKTYKDYEDALASGISREQARMLLPVCLYTEWFWKCNCHNLLHFLALRCDDHAQKETRVFAEAILALVRPIIPITIEAWEDYHYMRGAVNMSKKEMDSLKKFIKSLPSDLRKVPELDTDNKRESSEWIDKAKKLGLNV